MEPLLKVENLSKRYGSIIVADSLDLELDTGTCLGVIGPNGAGKTSLFNLLTGAVFPDAGRIRLAGHDITKTPLYRRTRIGIARAFQIPQPFTDLTVYENVLVGATFGAGLSGRRSQEKAAHALDVTGLLARRDERAGALSLLNRKRLEVAKSLAMRPKLLLLDEIASGLTELEIVQITDLVSHLKMQIAIIWIEHIAHALAKTCDRIMVMHFGRKLMEGAPATVMQSAEVKEIYMGITVDALA
jgi:branched-chain amino acid transport system ATP-binding protein